MQMRWQKSGQYGVSLVCFRSTHRPSFFLIDVYVMRGAVDILSKN